MEEKFGIQLPTEATDDLETLGDIVRFIDALVEQQSDESPAAPTEAAKAHST